MPPAPPAGLIRPVPTRSEKPRSTPSRASGRARTHKDSAKAGAVPDPKAYGYFTTPGCGAVTFTSGMPRNGMRELVTLPPECRITNMYGYNNPNFYAFPNADWSYIWNNTNRISYKTYVQFMMDFGREKTDKLSDTGVGQTPLSVASSYCPMHTEATAGGSFSFPPREQPMHAARRSLIAAIQVVKQFNASVPAAKGDWVSIVTFDSVDLPAGTGVDRIHNSQ